MTMEIGQLKKEHFFVVRGWWLTLRKRYPSPASQPESTTFVGTVENRPIVSMTVVLTNADFAIIENLIMDPAMKDRELRDIVLERMVAFGYAFAKEQGYERVVGFTSVQRLIERYCEVGGTVIEQGVSVLQKIL